MREYGLELVDLTGRWVGFYRHRWEELGTYPIVADLNQNGTKITGEMYDQITERSDYLDEYVDLIGKDIGPGVKTQIAAGGQAVRHRDHSERSSA